MDGRGYDHMQPYWEHAGHGHPVAWVLFLILLAIVVGVVSALVLRWLAGRSTVGAQPVLATGGAVADHALGLVRLRYARGEIDREQFLQATADLGGPAGFPAAGPPPDAPTAA